MNKWQLLAATMVVLIIAGVAYGLGSSNAEPAQAAETTEAPAIASPTVDPDVRTGELEPDEGYESSPDIPYTGGYSDPELIEEPETNQPFELTPEMGVDAMGPGFTNKLCRLTYRLGSVELARSTFVSSWNSTPESDDPGMPSGAAVFEEVMSRC